MAIQEEADRLAARAREGDAAAFGDLYALVWRDLYRFALYTLRRPEEAEDAVQECALEAFRSMGALRSDEAFRAWSFKILTRCCAKRLKKAAKEKQNVTFEELERQSVFLQARDTDAAERAAVWGALEQLNGQERLVVLLCVLGGYTSREVAALTGRPAGTVRSQLHRSLLRMRSALSSDGDGFPGLRLDNAARGGV